MTSYVAFLRGVSPVNCRMPELKACFEAAGFTNVRTILSSGNVAFSARPAIVPELETMAEQAMKLHLGRVFQAIVRPAAFLQALVETDVYALLALQGDAKRIVTFLRKPHEGSVDLPITRDQLCILRLEGTEVFSAYVPNEKGPVFMAHLERIFGKDITTRTLDTVRKCAAA